MAKRVLMILSVFMALFAVATFAAVENVKVSGDITAYGITRSDFTLGSSTPSPLTGATDVADDSTTVAASVSNLTLEADLTQDVSAKVTLTDERVWGLQADDIYASEAYITIKDLFDYPLTVKIGKQPVRLTNGAVLGDFDGPTNLLSTGAFNTGMIYDLSPRKNPEGVIAEYDLSAVAPLRLMGGYLKVSEGGTAAADASKDDDTNVMFGSLAYMVQDIPVLELYYAGRDVQDPKATNEDIDTYGGRLLLAPIENMIFMFEFAYQDQRKNSDNNAWLLATAAQYTFKDLPWTPVISADFSIATDKWDIMYEDVAVARITNAILADTDGVVIGGNLTLTPMEDLTLKLRYAHVKLYKANTALYSNYAYYVNTVKRDLGHEVDVAAVYDYTEDVQFGVEAGIFMPCEAFDESNRKNATQAIGTMKVSF